MYDCETSAETSSRNQILMYRGIIDEKYKNCDYVCYPILPFFARMVENLKKKLNISRGMDGRRLYLINKVAAKECTLGREWTVSPLSVISTTRAETSNQPSGRLSTSAVGQWLSKASTTTTKRVTLTFYRQYYRERSTNRWYRVRKLSFRDRQCASTIPP